LNAEGRLVQEWTQASNGTEHTWSLDASSWRAGFYIIRMNQGTSIRQHRWVKLK